MAFIMFLFFFSNFYRQLWLNFLPFVTRSAQNWPFKWNKKANEWRKGNGHFFWIGRREKNEHNEMDLDFAFETFLFTFWTYFQLLTRQSKRVLCVLHVTLIHVRVTFWVITNKAVFCSWIFCSCWFILACCYTILILTYSLYVNETLVYR